MNLLLHPAKLRENHFGYVAMPCRPFSQMENVMFLYLLIRRSKVGNANASYLLNVTH